MSDLNFDARKNHALLTSELEQRVTEMNHFLSDKGEDWCSRLDDLTMKMEDHKEQPWNTVGRLAQIGFLHCLTQLNGVYLDESFELDDIMDELSREMEDSDESEES